MGALIINGRQIAEEIKEEVRSDITRLKQEYGITPGLATILVGDDAASQSYVASKIRICHQLGIMSWHNSLPKDTTSAEIMRLINSLNENSSVHGILVQLPLPSNINEFEVLLAIDPAKDVDGFHPVNVGKLVIGEPAFLPCTPAGIQQMLIRSKIKTEGADIVVIGRSNLVGKPVANILMQKAAGADATVTICHSHTRNIAEHTRRADILIAAIGKANFITADMVKQGATVIDVGINRIGTTAEGKSILCGDVAFEEVKEKAGAITPVPGGVGLLTTAMLMQNTIKAARLSVNPVK